MSSIKLSHLYDPRPNEVGNTLYQFLTQLGGPTVIHLTGKQQDKCRVLVTLLHGNEPSGIKAVYTLLQQGFQPLYNVKIIIASVVAARTEPVFNHRMLPGQEDLNRCFGRSQKNLQCQLASAISESIVSWQPEAIVDMHNTSGSGPAFCVSTHTTPKHLALGSHFTHRMVYTDMRLGAIMEQAFACPIVTVEAGGAQDTEADLIALHGLESFFNAESLFALQQQIEVLSLPRRLEIIANSSIVYAMSQLDEYCVTMRQDIEKLNFAKTPQNTLLGWAANAKEQVLKIGGAKANLSDYFTLDNGELRTARDLILFMVTTRADIAKSDCLFYFVPVEM